MGKEKGWNILFLFPSCFFATSHLCHHFCHESFPLWLHVSAGSCAILLFCFPLPVGSKGKLLGPSASLVHSFILRMILNSYVRNCYNKISLFSPSLLLPSPPQICQSVWSRVQQRGGPQEGICGGVQNSRCPGNIGKIYIYKMSSPPQAWARGDGTHGAGPFRAVLGNNGFAANPWHGHLTYL